MAPVRAETLDTKGNTHMAHFWESGFVVREQAWHGLATVLDKAPTTAEALRQSQLDWHVNLTPVFAMPGMAPELAEKNGIAAAPLSDALYCDDARAMVREIHQRDGTLRSDVLGMVGTRYCPLQNTDAFRWFDPLCADGSVELESAGSVKGGRHVWILARIATKPLQVGRKPEDVATPYLLLSNSGLGGLRRRQRSLTSRQRACSDRSGSSQRASVQSAPRRPLMSGFG